MKRAENSTQDSEHQTNAKNVPQIYTRSVRKSSETKALCQIISLKLTVIDWEGATVVDRENNKRHRQDQSVSKRLTGPGKYSLSNIYRHLFATSNQSSGKQPSPLTSRGQSHSLTMILDDNRNFHSNTFSELHF